MASVASTASGMPRSWAAVASAAMSVICSSGLFGDSAQSSAAPSRAAIVASVSVWSTNSTSSAPEATRSPSSVRTPA